MNIKLGQKIRLSDGQIWTVDRVVIEKHVFRAVSNLFDLRKLHIDDLFNHFCWFNIGSLKPMHDTVFGSNKRYENIVLLDDYNLFLED